MLGSPMEPDIPIRMSPLWTAKAELFAATDAGTQTHFVKSTLCPVRFDCLITGVPDGPKSELLKAYPFLILITSPSRNRLHPAGKPLIVLPQLPRVSAHRLAHLSP